MKTPFPLFVFASIVIINACNAPLTNTNTATLVSKGRMPSLCSDTAGHVFIAFGSADSIFLITASGNGPAFSTPELVAVLPGLVASSMRGPQVASTSSELIITAGNKAGNLFSFSKSTGGNWLPAVKINDVDTVSKEGLTALGADGSRAFAVWLDLRDGHNKIMGASSADGGKTWSANTTAYASPDTTVCECCKPSVVVKGDNVYIMFRNQLAGMRDLYLVQSADAGKHFSEAQQLGTGSWALNGCPMDGGGLVINHGIAETLWRRKDSIFYCKAGEKEMGVGKGKNCTIESINGKNLYAWTENGDVIIVTPDGSHRNLGKGQLPQIKRMNDTTVLCVWENEKQVYAEMVACEE